MKAKADLSAVFRINHPTRFFSSAAISGLVTLGIVYPWLHIHPELIAVPLVCGAIVSVLAEMVPIGIIRKASAVFGKKTESKVDLG
jgi:hypothetical protein